MRREALSLSFTGSHAVLHTPLEQRVHVRENDWQRALTEAFRRHGAHGAQGKFEVQVQLGQDHARVAIMLIEQPGGLVSIPSARHDALVHAWAADMLHIDPGEHIIRWRALADARQVLVSCVNRALAEELERGCGQAGVRLASCRPAILSTMRAAEQVFEEGTTHDLTVIWTEDGPADGRHGVVQLLRFRDRQLTSTWRGWLPDESGAGDAALDAIISRFEAANEPAKIARAKMHWPSPATR